MSDAAASSSSRAQARNRRPRFVVGFDDSDYAWAALRYAVGRAGEGGSLVVVHAHPVPPDDLPPKIYERMLEDHLEEGRAVLDRLTVERPEELGSCEWSAHLVGGGAADVLIALAEREDADEIVVGTHGRGRVSALLGSVAHDLLRLADRPVAVIPPRALDRRG